MRVTAAEEMPPQNATVSGQTLATVVFGAFFCWLTAVLIAEQQINQVITAFRAADKEELDAWAMRDLQQVQTALQRKLGRKSKYLKLREDIRGPYEHQLERVTTIIARRVAHRIQHLTARELPVQETGSFITGHEPEANRTRPDKEAAAPAGASGYETTWFHGIPRLLDETTSLPQWLLREFEGIPDHGVAGWPQFRQDRETIDWPRIIRERPDEIRFTQGAPASMIDALWKWAMKEGLTPRLDVALFVEADGTIGVSPWGWGTMEHLGSSTIHSVHEIMVGHGFRPEHPEHGKQGTRWVIG